MQKLLLYICIILLSTQCAQITPLTGGKKDITPPKAVSYYPENATLNFNSKTIEIQFDEYIVLKDVANQFIITPQTKEMPDIQASGKKLKITFNEALLPNTTYQLAFGNSISDLNESNTLRNFEYIFSTGNVIDSLKLSGDVINSVNNKPVSELLIGLYPKDSNDSIIYKDKPLYISKTNSNGKFIFNYLPNSAFKIAAIKDQNKNLLYDGSDEQLAFSDKYVNTTDSNQISLTLFKEVHTKNFIKKPYSAEYGKAYIIYNKPQIDIKSIDAKGLLSYSQNKSKDTLMLYYDNKFDTLETILTHTNGKIDTVYIKLLNSTAHDKQIKNKLIKYTLQSNISSVLAFYQLPLFELNFPVNPENIINDKISLLEQGDSLVRNKTIRILKNELSSTTFTIQTDFKAETNYTLTILKSAIINNNERFNDSVSYKFKTTAIDDYAQLNLKLYFPKKENYILMLLNEKEEIVDERLVDFSLTSTSEKFIQYKNLLPGNYFVKVAEDANKNGHFDTGNYFSHKQPEIIYMNSTPIKLLAGWEIENEWIVK